MGWKMFILYFILWFGWTDPSIRDILLNWLLWNWLALNNISHILLLLTAGVFLIVCKKPFKKNCFTGRKTTKDEDKRDRKATYKHKQNKMSIPQNKRCKTKRKPEKTIGFNDVLERSTDLAFLCKRVEKQQQKSLNQLNL